MKTIIDRIAADELKLFADNDSEVYFKSFIPTCDNMSRKVKKGNFDKEKAVKGFMYVAEFAAKKYCKEFGGIWYQVFNKATREETAKAMLEDFIADNNF